MKAKFTNKILVFALGLFLSGGIVLASCGGRSSKSVDAKEKEGTPTNVHYIDGKQMQEQVYDFKANPKTFVYKGNKPAIIDFYADWCGPCRQLSPKLNELAKKYADKLVIYKIDVDKEGELARHFGVSSIPMLLFVPVKGTPIQTMGNLPMSDLEATLAKVL
ncbi:thioredoxin [Porphyromonas crevioricanis JCM 15906]|uniref:Thioredoxin n=1 Tax=Porphyromonas crevioricanis JCM 15906 TaxID=1305617 RepID=T1CPU0_9PORP|nr:thioredoxin domain-containing protein [Porphyromonas crevioricanis]GAD05128.1 thioredoxin [Porphyromonas crevioricanis JCM 15906]SJZ84294.1 thioredoxin [Porphyromonas crevioricanis]